MWWEWDQRRNCKSGLHLPITVDCLSGVDQTSDITPEEEGREGGHNQVKPSSIFFLQICSVNPILGVEYTLIVEAFHPFLSLNTEKSKEINYGEKCFFF